MIVRRPMPSSLAAVERESFKLVRHRAKTASTVIDGPRKVLHFLALQLVLHNGEPEDRPVWRHGHAGPRDVAYGLPPGLHPISLYAHLGYAVFTSPLAGRDRSAAKGAQEGAIGKPIAPHRYRNGGNISLFPARSMRYLPLFWPGGAWPAGLVREMPLALPLGVFPPPLVCVIFASTIRPCSGCAGWFNVPAANGIAASRSAMAMDRINVLPLWH